MNYSSTKSLWTVKYLQVSYYWIFLPPIHRNQCFVLSVTILLEFQSLTILNTWTLGFCFITGNALTCIGYTMQPNNVNHVFYFLCFFFQIQQECCEYCVITAHAKNVPSSSLFKELCSHNFFSTTLHTKTRFWQIQRICMQCMWVFSTPYFPIWLLMYPLNRNHTSPVKNQLSNTKTPSCEKIMLFITELPSNC